MILRARPAVCCLPGCGVEGCDSAGPTVLCRWAIVVQPCPVHGQNGCWLLCKANYSNSARSTGAAGGGIHVTVMLQPCSAPRAENRHYRVVQPAAPDPPTSAFCLLYFHLCSSHRCRVRPQSPQGARRFLPWVPHSQLRLAVPILRAR